MISHLLAFTPIVSLRIFLCWLLLVVCFPTASNAQSLYFGLNASASTSYLRNEQPTSWGLYKVEGRKNVYYPGGQLGLNIGCVPMKTAVSPVFEFSASYLYRRFGQEYHLTYMSSAQNFYDVRLRPIKASHDIFFGLRIGVKYKGLVFLTGPTFGKFLAGSIYEKTTSNGTTIVDWDGKLGKRFDDYYLKKYSWTFDIRYQLAVGKGFFISPFVSYDLGFASYNHIDSSFGWYYGKVSTASAGVVVLYSLRLKHK